MTSFYSWGARLLVLSSVLEVASVSGNKLIVFAGPHKAASTSIEEFFYEYAGRHARTDNDGNKLALGDRKKTFGLRYWIWPQISGVAADNAEPEHPSKIFGHLVTEESNTVLKNEILDGIRENWETTGIEGLILGSENFDQVGPDVEYDATLAVQSIVESINANPYDVTVVLNYRNPRLEQWASMWKHDATGTNEQGDDFSVEYEEWLCDKNKVDQHVRVLATEMNPFNAAEAYAKLGYDVKLIDMEGVKEAGRDVVHVIACDIATGKCDDGVVRNHENDSLQKNSIQVEFSALTESQRTDAEKLFRYRDCAYKDLRENVKFGILYNHSIWAECDDKSAKIYQQLRDDPSFMYKALVDQITCPESTGHPIPASERISMNQALTGSKSKQSVRGTPVSKQSVSGTPVDGGAGIGGIFMELFVFICIFTGAMGSQYVRMSTTSRSLGGGQTMRSTVRMGSLVEAEGRFTNDVDAEYRDTDIDGDDDLPSGFRDRRK